MFCLSHTSEERSFASELMRDKRSLEFSDGKQMVLRVRNSQKKEKKKWEEHEIRMHNSPTGKIRTRTKLRIHGMARQAKRIRIKQKACERFELPPPSPSPSPPSLQNRESSKKILLIEGVGFFGRNDSVFEYDTIFFSKLSWLTKKHIFFFCKNGHIFNQNTGK